MVNTNPQETGKTERIDTETAYIIMGPNTVAEVASMTVEVEHNFERTDLLSGNTTEFDGRVKLSSGSLEISPKDPSIGTVQDLVLNRAIFDVLMVFPERDIRGGIRGVDCRIETQSEGDIESGSEYLTTFDFSGNYVESQ